MRELTSEKPRILFVHDRFGAYAGAESNILATATELRARGWTTGILHGEPTGITEDKWHEAFALHLPLIEGTEGGTTEAVLLFQPDVIYVHNFSNLPAIEELLASRVPIARMVHDHDLYCMRSYKYNYFTRQICDRSLSPYCLFPCGAFLARDHRGAVPVKWISYLAKSQELRLNRRFDRLLVASDFMKEELLRNQFEPDKIEIHPPVPRDGTAGVESNFSDRNLIIYSGQITRGKGVDVLLESLARVTVPFECFIFGDGNYRSHCERVALELGLGDRVQFKGWVPPTEIARHFQECSAVVMSSVWPEPFGAAGLEGMRYGLPVVAFDAGGIKEWLTDGVNGYLVPWMDRAAYAQRIETLLTNKLLARQLGTRGRQTLADCFSFAKYLDGLEGLFQRLAQRDSQIALS